MATDANQALVRRFFEEMCNGRQLEVAEELFSADHAYHDPAIPTGPGPAGMQQVIAPYHQAYPDARWTIDEMLSAGDAVVTRWTGRGTQQGELMGIAPTGKAVTVPGIWIHRIRGGKIVESWNCWGTLLMLQQLGVVPTFGQARS